MRAVGIRASAGLKVTPLLVFSEASYSASRSMAMSSDSGVGSGDNGASITVGAGAGPIGFWGGSGIDRYNSPRPTPNPIALITTHSLRRKRGA